MTQDVFFFHLLFLVQHKFGANHQSKPPDDSPAYYKGTCGLRREESIQPCITPAFVARARSNCCSAQCTTPTRLVGRWTGPVDTLYILSKNCPIRFSRRVPFR